MKSTILFSIEIVISVIDYLRFLVSLHDTVFSDKYSFLKYEKYIYIENEM